MKTVRTKIEFMAALQKELERFGIADKVEILADFEQHFGDSAKQGLSEAEICEKLGDVADIAAQYAEEDNENMLKTAPVFPDPTIVIPAAPVFTEYQAPVKEENTDFGPLVLDDFGDAKEIEELIKAAPVHPDAEDKSEQSVAAKPDVIETENENAYVKAEACRNSASTGWSSFSANSMNINVGGLIGVLCVDFFVLSWALPAFFSVVIGLLSIPVALIGSGIGMIIDGALKSFNIGTIFNTFSFGVFGGISTILLGVVLLCLGGLFVLIGIQLVKLCIKAVKGVINWHGTMIVGRTVFKSKNKYAKN